MRETECIETKYLKHKSCRIINIIHSHTAINFLFVAFLPSLALSAL